MSQLANIETFVEVGQRLSFAAAARRLGLPASTVTTRIKTLEQELGARLLDRTTRTVSLTDEGTRFLEHCKRALESLDDARQSVGVAQRASGTVRLSVPTAFPSHKLAELLSDFLVSYPEIDLQVDVSDRTVSFVADGADLALRGRDPGNQAVIARLLSRTPIRLFARAGGLYDETLPMHRPTQRDYPQDFDGVRIRTRSMALTLSLVLQGRIRAQLPESLCAEYVADGVLDTADTDETRRQSLALYLVYPEGQHMPFRVQLLKKYLIEQLSA